MNRTRTLVGRTFVVVAAIAMVGEGWLGLQRHPGPEVSYASQPYIAAAGTPGGYADDAQPRECDPAANARSSCIFQ